jgi:hypothetical protein
MMHDFLDNLGAQQYEKMRKRNATKEEIINTCEETFGKECYDKEFWEDYQNNTAKEKNNTEETSSNN